MPPKMQNLAMAAGFGAVALFFLGAKAEALTIAFFVLSYIGLTYWILGKR